MDCTSLGGLLEIDQKALYEFTKKYNVRHLEIKQQKGYNKDIQTHSITATQYLKTYTVDVVSLEISMDDLKMLVARDWAWERDMANTYIRSQDARVQAAYDKYLTLCNLVKGDYLNEFNYR